MFEYSFYCTQEKLFLKYTTRASPARATDKTNPPALQGYYSGGFGDLDKHPALVRYCSEGAVVACLCISYKGKLLQHKLIRVQCTKKSTRVPVSHVPQYGYSV